MFVLTKLPYAEDALAPAISADTVKTHYHKHHAAYVEKTNDLAAKQNLADVALEDLIARARGHKDQALFNQAAQAWNHGFYWESMTPTGGGDMGALAAAIANAFGDAAGFRTHFLDAGEQHFGSGWLWLVRQADEVKLAARHDADNPLGGPGKPLLVCDLWEHAYYLDRKNLRRAYLEAWFDKLANWSFAETQWRAAEAGGGWRYPAPVKRAA